MKAESGLGEDTTIKLHSLFDAVGAYVYAKDRSGRYLNHTGFHGDHFV